MADRKKPAYVNANGVVGIKDLPTSPPFLFREVTTRVFPLKANMARLTDFVDKYLNMDVGDEICHFRPSLPYVYLMVLNYGSLSPTSVSAQNVGWVAQHEVTFTIPLEWWRKENGRMVFKDWATVSPFIYVDDDISQTTGREVYGWPKVKAFINRRTAPLWVEDPRSPTQMLCMSVPIISTLYAGAREEPRELLVIERDPPPSFSMFPPDLNSPANPIADLSGAVKSWLGLMGDAAEILTELPIRGYRLPTQGFGARRDRFAYAKMLGKAAGIATRLLPDLLRQGPMGKLLGQETGEDTKYAEIFVNQITLKQFRDAEDPNQACYQALVNSRMGYNRLNRLGLLGDLSLLRGDPSGGFNIRIHEYQAQPIIESLGLEVLRTESGREAPVAVLKPTFPFWMDMDLYYGTGQVICSRSPCAHGTEDCTAWRPGPGVEPDGRAKAPPALLAAPAAATGQAAPAHAGHACGAAEKAKAPSPVYYNTARAAATQPIAGPFHFPDVTVQIYPLLADGGKLGAFIDHYLNHPLGNTDLSYEPFGHYVYLMVQVYGDGDHDAVMWSETDNIGWWADKSVSFCVPVKCYRGSGAGRKLESIALVSPYSFGNSGRAVISDREVNGRPTVKANIESHPDVWLDEAGPVAPRRMLKMDTEVFPALNVGQKAVMRTLLEIDEHSPLPASDTVGWRLIEERWRDPLIGELKRKARFARDFGEAVDDVKALALAVLAQDVPIHWLHLKQYRDTADTDTACYQALVRTSRYINRIYDIREIDRPIFVRLHHIPDHPIAQALGIKSMHVVSNSEGVVRIIQPIRPFWMRVGFKEELGKLLRWRTEAGPWASTKASRQPTDDGRTEGVGRGVLKELRESGRCLREQASRWLHEQLSKEARSVKEVIAPGLTPEICARLRADLASLPRDIADSKGWPKAREVLELLLDQPDTGDTPEGRRLEQLFRTLSTEALYEVLETLNPLFRTCGMAMHSERLSSEAARQSLALMDDLQVVIESILADAWESEATPDSGPRFWVPLNHVPEGLRKDWFPELGSGGTGGLREENGKIHFDGRLPEDKPAPQRANPSPRQGPSSSGKK